MTGERITLIPSVPSMMVRLSVIAVGSLVGSATLVGLCAWGALPLKTVELWGTARLVAIASGAALVSLAIVSAFMMRGLAAVHRRAAGGDEPLLPSHARDAFLWPGRALLVVALAVGSLLVLDELTDGALSNIQGPRRMAVEVLAFGVFQGGLIFGALGWRRALWRWLSQLRPSDVELPTKRVLARRYALRVGSAFGMLGCAVVSVPLAYLSTAQELTGLSSARLEPQGGLLFLAGAACAALLTGLIAVFYGLRLGRRIAADLRDLETYVRSLEAGVYDDRPVALRTRAAHRLAMGARQLSRKYADLAQTEARARRAVEGTQRLKTRFMAFMSHDLRSPLNSITGFADILADEVDGRLNSEQRKSVDAIREAGQVLLRLVTDIVDTARVEAGKLRLARQPTRPEALVEGAVLRAREAAAGALRFDVEVDAELPDVLVDPERAEQALVGVLSHVGRMARSGTIRIRGTAGSGPPGPSHQLRVEIDADELPSEDTQRIFVAFREIRRPSGRRVGGLGLGLALARTLAVAHGGELFYETSGPSGARFTFALPIGEEEPVF